jgi:hypothetical protein
MTYGMIDELQELQAKLEAREAMIDERDARIAVLEHQLEEAIQSAVGFPPPQYGVSDEELDWRPLSERGFESFLEEEE